MVYTGLIGTECVEGRRRAMSWLEKPFPTEGAKPKTIADKGAHQSPTDAIPSVAKSEAFKFPTGATKQ
jgi:hypothetical protein